ncbi:MAG: aspartate/glutamate racemase family protein, partial [Eubacterium sp.]|nr:aspartate/glutamate racemase family protein [Eubacterium sp.]
ASISSGSYTKEIQKLKPEAEVFGVSCPVLVTLVENNWIDEDDYISREIIKRYVQPLLADGVDTIILGCTHFPHLAPLIQSVVGNDITLIDSGYEAVMEAKKILQEMDIANSNDNIATAKYYVSDKMQNFSTIANSLLGMDISGEVEYKDITE